MNRILQFAIFMLVFLTVYLGMNLYVVTRIFSLLGLKTNIYVYLLAIILAISIIIATIVETKTHNYLTKNVYFLSVTWVGVLFWMFCFLLLFEILNILFTLPKFYSGIAIIFIVFVLTAFSLLNGLQINVKTVEIPMKIEKDITAVQITDIHLGSIHERDYLERIVEKVNEIDPDVVFLTGDLFDGSARITSDDLEPLNDIKVPIYFVTGNHDYIYGLNESLKLLETTKIEVLRNKITDFRDIQLIGLDYSETTNPMKEVLPNIKFDKEKPSILLYHPPVNVNKIVEQGINLHLAGHVHNGQIFPFNLFIKLVHPYSRGLHKRGNSYEYVSVGTGTLGPPMRLASTNEITIIKLKKA